MERQTVAISGGGFVNICFLFFFLKWHFFYMLNCNFTTRIIFILFSHATKKQTRFIWMDLKYHQVIWSGLFSFQSSSDRFRIEQLFYKFYSYHILISAAISIRKKRPLYSLFAYIHFCHEWPRMATNHHKLASEIW